MQTFCHCQALPVIEDNQAPAELASAPGDDNEEAESDTEPLPPPRRRCLVINDADDISVATAHSEDEQEANAQTGRRKQAVQKGAETKKSKVLPSGSPLHLSSAVRKTVEAEKRAKAVISGVPASSSATEKPQKKSRLASPSAQLPMGKLGLLILLFPYRT